MFKFRSGTHGLKEELGGHKEGKEEWSAYCVMMNVRTLVMIVGLFSLKYSKK